MLKRKKNRSSLASTDQTLPTVSAVPTVAAIPVQGTKRKFIFSESLEDLGELDESIKKKPFSSFSKVPTNFDGSKYSFSFSVEPNLPTSTMSTEYDLSTLDDITLTSMEKSKQVNGRLQENGKPTENVLKKAPATATHDEFDDLLNDSFDDLFDDIQIESQDSPELRKPEGFRKATGELIVITDEQLQLAMQRFEGLTDLTKEVASYIWHYRRKLI